MKFLPPSYTASVIGPLPKPEPVTAITVYGQKVLVSQKIHDEIVNYITVAQPQGDHSHSIGLFQVVKPDLDFASGGALAPIGPEMPSWDSFESKKETNTKIHIPEEDTSLNANCTRECITSKQNVTYPSVTKEFKDDFSRATTTNQLRKLSDTYAAAGSRGKGIRRWFGGSKKSGRS